MLFDNRLKIEKTIEDKKVTAERRRYLGISKIGHYCKRNIWYTFRLFLPAEELTARQVRLFQRGHNEEEIILHDLKEAGVKIISTQNEIVACSGHIKGHCDAILGNLPDAPKTEHLGEFKTSATKYFEILIKEQSVKKAFPSHFDQMQGYMHKLKLKRALYVCVNKEDDRRYYERIEYDKAYAEAIFAKGEEIVLAEQPPERIGDSRFFKCGPKWCEYREICHFEETETIDKNCRTCRNIEVHDKGRWYCKKKKEFRSFKNQCKGCKKWLLL